MSTSIPPTGSSTTGTTDASIQNPNGTLGKDDFLKLLVTQLQNQDPMNPMDEKDFMGQMAQFSTLEQITNLVSATTVSGFSGQVSQSVGLIGHQVTWADGNGNVGSGQVQTVTIDGSNILLTVDGQQINPSDIVQVS
jgi:flagellar basal-body rod modification protein FlgD